MSGLSRSGSTFAVTGGVGFIGGHLVDALVSAGATRVVVLDARAAQDTAQLASRAHPAVELVPATLGAVESAALARKLEGVDGLFHLAALKHNAARSRPLEMLRQNVEGSAALFEAAGRAGVRKVVFASSLYAYGRDRGAPFDEAEPARPRTVYGISKHAGEQLLAHASVEHAFAGAALRYLFVYGPRQFTGSGYKSVIVSNFERLLRGEPALVRGDGEQRLDYVYVDDAVEATLLAMERDLSPATTPGDALPILNIGSGRGVRVRELVETLCRISGSSAGLHHADADETAGSQRVASVEAAARALGWRATTPLETGLTRTWEWIREASAARDAP